MLFTINLIIYTIKRKKTTGYRHLMKLLWIILLGAIWGISFSIARFATTHGVSPLGYAMWQSLGPAILLIIILKLFKVKFPSSWRHWRFYFICGLFGIAVPNTNMYFAAPHLPAGVLGVIINTSALMIYVLALLLRVEKFNWLRSLGVFSAFVGVMCIILPRTSLPSHDMLFWVLLALISPLAFAFTTLYITKYRPKEINILNSAAGMLIVSSIILIPIVLISRDFYPLTFAFTAPEIAVIAEIILSAIGYLLLFRILRTAGPVYYSLVGPIVVLTGFFWGWIFFAETLNSWLIAAVIFIISGILLVTLGHVVSSRITTS